MVNKKKIDFQIFAAFMLVLIGCALLIAGFIVNPLGVIDASVLTAFGEACTFAGALFGIDYTYKYKAFKKSKETKVDNDN